MKVVLRYFVQGCLVTAPIAITGYILYFALAGIGRLMPSGFPLAGVAILLAAITAVGFFASSMLGRALVEGLEGWMRRVPLVKLLYGAIKDLIGAFVGDKRSFDKPVLVALSADRSLQALGFLTQESVSFADDCVAVYLPQSYNFAGNVLVCKRDRVTPLSVESADLMAFVVSGGVSLTQQEAERRSQTDASTPGLE